MMATKWDSLGLQGHELYTNKAIHNLVTFPSINLRVEHMACTLLQDTLDLGSTIIVQMLKDFLNGKWKWIVHVIKVYLFHDMHFIYVVEAFITLN